MAGLVEGGSIDSGDDTVLPKGFAGKEMQRSQLHDSGPGRPRLTSSLEGGMLTKTGETVGYTPGKARRRSLLFCGLLWADVAPVAGLRYVIGEEGRNGSGEKKRARWSFGEAEIIWWNARETLWARSSSRCDRLMRTCSRSSGRSKVRIAAVLSIRSDIFTDVPDSATRL